MSSMTQEDLTSLIHLIGYNMNTVMINVFGNFFFQKLVENLSGDLRLLLLKYVNK